MLNAVNLNRYFNVLKDLIVVIVGAVICLVGVDARP